jgi:hypothetical protein
VGDVCPVDAERGVGVTSIAKAGVGEGWWTSSRPVSVMIQEHDIVILEATYL